MDIPELSMAMSQANVMNQISFALMGKALEQMKQNGEALMGQLVETPSGTMTADHIDVLV